MKKICFLIGNLDHSGGTERVTSLIANELTQKGYHVSILSLAEGTKPYFTLLDGIKTDGLYPHKVSMKSNFFGAILRIRRYVQENSINTLIVVDSISCVFTVPALFGLKVKHICWEHFNFNVDLGVSYRRLGRKWAAKYCDAVVTLTKRDKELWENGLKRVNANIITIANPSPYEVIEHTPRIEDKIVLSLGRLTYPKGFDLLIEAWSLVCSKNNDWTLRIVGSGEDEEQLKNQAKRLGVYGRIEFIPSVKEVEQYYRTSSIYCMSSRFEGLPMVLLEAQSFGLPIISFDCDTGPSDIIDHGVNGFLVEDLNVQLLANQLLVAFQMSVGEYSILSNNAITNSGKYNIANITHHWIGLLEDN